MLECSGCKQRAVPVVNVADRPQPGQVGYNNDRGVELHTNPGTGTACEGWGKAPVPR
jgi:hypothetical protein